MQYETANIIYKGLADKGLTVQLTDENKKSWTIWKKDYKNKEQDSDAYAALQQFKFGDSFGVSYQEKDESFIGKDGKTVNFKRKTIYSIMPTIASPTSTLKTSKSAPQQEIKYEANKDTNWDEIAVGKCQSLFIAAYLQSGKTFADAKLQVVQARQLAELVVYGSQKSKQDEGFLPGESDGTVGQDVPLPDEVGF